MASQDDQPGDWPAPTPCAAIRGLWALGIPDMVYRMCTLPHHATRMWPSSVGLRSQRGRPSAVTDWLEVGVLGIPERDLPVRDGDALFEEAFGQFPADFCLAVPLATASDWTLLPDPVALSSGGVIIPPEPAAGVSSGALLYRALKDLFNALLLEGISRIGRSDAYSVMATPRRLVVASGSAGGPERTRRATETGLDGVHRQLHHGRQVQSVLSLLISGGMTDVKSASNEYGQVNSAITSAFSHPDLDLRKALLYPLDDFDGLRVTLIVAVGQ